MDDSTRQKLETRASILKALGHPSRLYMVEQLTAQGKLCVCELTDMVGSDISTISKHLKILKDAGLVKNTKQGNQIFYEIRCPCTMDFFNCVERVLEQQQQSS